MRALAHRNVKLPGRGPRWWARDRLARALNISDAQLGALIDARVITGRACLMPQTMNGEPFVLADSVLMRSVLRGENPMGAFVPVYESTVFECESPTRAMGVTLVRALAAEELLSDGDMPVKELRTPEEINNAFGPGSELSRIALNALRRPGARAVVVARDTGKKGSGK
jgi:hypothetical protein